MDNLQFQIGYGFLRYLGFLVAITMYQAGMAFVAVKKGDRSSQTQTLATVNPFVHMEFFGTVVLPLLTIIVKLFVLFIENKEPTRLCNNPFDK